MRLRHSASVSLANYDPVAGIPLVTLDDVVHEHIDVLKMDCQVVPGGVGGCKEVLGGGQAAPRGC